MFILEVCDNSNLLNAILFVKNMINIIFIVVPIVLALLFTIDLAKNVFAKDDKEADRNLRMGIKRIVYSLILFFVPLLVETFMSAIEGYSKVANCYTIATEEKVKELVEKEEAEYKAKQEEKRKEQEENASKVAAEIAEAQEAAASAAQRAIESLKSQSSDSSSSSSASTLDLSSASSGAEKIALTAETLAWPLNTKESVWHHHYQYDRKWNSWSELTSAKPTKAFMDAYDKVKPGHFKIAVSKTYGTKHTRIGASCDKFVGTVVRYSGYDSSFPDALGTSQNNRLANTNKWQKVSTSKAKRGAVCIKKDGTHILIYLGDGKVAHAGYGGIGKNNGKFGRIEKYSLGSSYNCWNATK